MQSHGPATCFTHKVIAFFVRMYTRSWASSISARARARRSGPANVRLLHSPAGEGVIHSDSSQFECSPHTPLELCGKLRGWRWSLLGNSLYFSILTTGWLVIIDLWRRSSTTWLVGVLFRMTCGSHIYVQTNDLHMFWVMEMEMAPPTELKKMASESMRWMWHCILAVPWLGMSFSYCSVRGRSASVICSSHITQYWSLTWCILSRSSPRLLLSSSSAPPSSSTSPNIPLVLQTQTPSRPTEGNFIHLSRCNSPRSSQPSHLLQCSPLLQAPAWLHRRLSRISTSSRACRRVYRLQHRPSTHSVALCSSLAKGLSR